jgi:uncharacterized protein (TIGR03083 family)
VTASSSTTRIDFVESFVSVARRFAAAVELGDLGARVPACPTWTAYDVVVHLGNVHAWAATILETGNRAELQEDEPKHRRPGVAGEWYAAKAEDLYAVLRAADPDADAWNFAGVLPTKAFWIRRQVHETSMHLVDLEQAAGRKPTLDPLLSTDGIAEVFEVFLPRMHSRGHRADLTEPITFRALDTDHAWTLQPRHDAAPAVAVRIEPGADLIEGPAGALFKLLWKRAGTDHPDVSYVGNADRIERFVASRLTP